MADYKNDVHIIREGGIWMYGGLKYKNYGYREPNYKRVSPKLRAQLERAYEIGRESVGEELRGLIGAYNCRGHR